MGQSSEVWIQAILSGLSVGAIYGLLALGINLLYACSGIINLAHGSMVVFVGGLLIVLQDDIHAMLLPAVGIALGAGLGLVFDVGVIRLMRRRSAPPVSMLLATIAAGFVLTGFAIRFIGTEARGLPALHRGTIDIAGAVLPTQRLIMFIAGLAFSLAILIAISSTNAGRAFRAVASNPVGAMAVGILPDRFVTWALVMGGATAGLAAGLVLPETSLSVAWGLRFTELGLIAATIGGLGSIHGSLVGGFLVGLVSGFTTVWWPEWFDVAQFSLLVLVLATRPSGLFRLGARPARRARAARAPA